MDQKQHAPADICGIVSSFAARQDSSVEQIVDLFVRLNSVGNRTGARILPVEQKNSDGHVCCLLCGKGFKMLKRHLRTAHGLSEMEYRIQFGLSEDLPLVAPEYSRRKADQAREAGFGRRGADRPGA